MFFGNGATVSSSASSYRTQRYSHPFFETGPMSPTMRPVTFGLAA